MKSFSALAAAALLSTAGNIPASVAGEVAFQSRAGERASLLELYTSEGCSSCPPAEAWLGRLKANPRLWTEFVPVAFHVDYWDNLGWKDRFASGTFTARQRDYAARWGGDSIYTPGFVLDGREWRNWGASGGQPPASGRAADPGSLVATVRENGRAVKVVFQPTNQPKAAREAFVTLLGFDLQSSVKAGENRGRALSHDFVALGWEKQTLTPGPAGRQEATVRLPEPPKDAGRLALAVWVTEAGKPGAEQVVGGWLTAAASPGIAKAER